MKTIVVTKTLSNRKILVVDDEESIRNFLNRLLKKEGYGVILATNGKESIDLAKAHIPDLILMDITMPMMNGYAACMALRSDFKTRYIPIIFLSIKGTTPEKVQGLKLGADDYIAKPPDPEELKARVETVLLRSQRNLSINPLTKLPGNSLIEEEVNERIKNQMQFGFAYLDIDHFKAYNDLYGFKKGDEVIQLVSSLITDHIQENGSQEIFVGHIGGDDFAFMTSPTTIENVSRNIATSFDKMIITYYSDEDKKRGFVVTKNRQGILAETPLMSISIAVVTNENRTLSHFGKVVEIASEMKRYAKSIPNRKGSMVLKDKRKD